MPRCFTILYPFMSERLHIHGYAMMVYAVIFGFYIRDRVPVPIPYRIFCKIIGTSKVTVSKCLDQLESMGLIIMKRHHGKTTMYSINHLDDILEYYLEESGMNEGSKVNESLVEIETSKEGLLVKRVYNNQYSKFTSTCKDSLPHNRIINKNIIKDDHVSSIRVPDASEYLKPSGLKSIGTCKDSLQVGNTRADGTERKNI